VVGDKVYRRKQNPVTVIYADGSSEVVEDWHNSTPERRAAEDKRKRLRKQKWLMNKKRKQREGRSRIAARPTRRRKKRIKNKAGAKAG
jgi:hypothetical protein